MLQNAKSILIVNGEPDIAALFADILLMDVEKYIINMARTGNECLLAMKIDFPDLILLDLDLPDIDGWDLLVEIRKIDENVPVIVITGRLPDPGDSNHLSMISDYLMKPVTIDGLHMAVKDGLNVPLALNKCIETVKSDNKELRNQLEKSVRLIERSIIDRKLLILMKQLYLDKRLKNDPVIKICIDTLRKKIDEAHIEIESFKNREYLLFDIKS